MSLFDGVGRFGVARKAQYLGLLGVGVWLGFTGMFCRVMEG